MNGSKLITLVKFYSKTAVYLDDDLVLDAANPPISYVLKSLGYRVVVKQTNWEDMSKEYFVNHVPCAPKSLQTLLFHFEYLETERRRTRIEQLKEELRQLEQPDS